MDFDRLPRHDQTTMSTTMNTTLTGALRPAMGPARRTPLARADRVPVA